MRVYESSRPSGCVSGCVGGCVRGCVVCVCEWWGGWVGGWVGGGGCTRSRRGARSAVRRFDSVAAPEADEINEG